MLLRQMPQSGTKPHLADLITHNQRMSTSVQKYAHCLTQRSGFDCQSRTLPILGDLVIYVTIAAERGKVFGLAQGLQARPVCPLSRMMILPVPTVTHFRTCIAEQIRAMLFMAVTSDPVAAACCRLHAPGHGFLRRSWLRQDSGDPNFLTYLSNKLVNPKYKGRSLQLNCGFVIYNFSSLGFIFRKIVIHLSYLVEICLVIIFASRFAQVGYQIANMVLNDTVARSDNNWIYNAVVLMIIVGKA